MNAVADTLPIRVVAPTGCPPWCSAHSTGGAVDVHNHTVGAAAGYTVEVFQGAGRPRFVTILDEQRGEVLTIELQAAAALGQLLTDAAATR